MAPSNDIVINKEDTKFGHLFNIIKNILKCVGLNIFGETWSKLRISFFVLVCIVDPLSSVYSAYMLREDFEELIMCLVAVGLAIQRAAKVLSLCWNQHKLIQMMDRMRNSSVDNVVVPKHKEIVDSYIKMSRIVTLTITTLYVMTIPALILFPIVIWKRLELPLSFYVPFLSRGSSPGFEINYIYQLIEMYFSVAALAGSDAILFWFILHTCGQLDIISHDLAYLGNDECCIMGFENQYELLQRCYKLHLEVLNFIDDINEVFSISNLAELVSCTMMFCMLLTVLDKNPINSYLIVFIATIFQLLLFCYFGDLLLTSCGNICTSLTMNKFYTLNSKEGKSLVIMISASQMVQPVKAGGFFELRLVNFVLVMRSAYSFFTVVRG